jgi:hypothetical protein
MERNITTKCIPILKMFWDSLIVIDLWGPAFNVTHFESRITHLLYTAINTTEHG